MKRHVVVLMSVLLPAASVLADLCSVNVGLDIVSNDVTADVDFFSGDNTGATISGPYYRHVSGRYWGIVGGHYEWQGWSYVWVPEYGWIYYDYDMHYSGTSLTVSLDTASMFGGLDVQNAELFLDFEGLDAIDCPQVTIEGNPVSGFAFISEAPVEGGPIGARASGDASNAFLSLTDYVSELATDNSFEITFHNLAPELYGGPASFRIDGLNIQADVLAAVPVPGAVLLGGMGLVSSGLYLRRRIA